MKIITRGLKIKISFLLVLIIISCENKAKKGYYIEEENIYYLDSLKIWNYKYVSAPFAEAEVSTILRFKNSVSKEHKVVNSYDSFQFILNDDTLRLGKKVAPDFVYIKKNQTLIFEFRSPIYRDLENYDKLIELIKKGTLYAKDENGNFIPVIKSKGFYIDEGGKKGDLEW
ncbi:hypothetical protein [Winogradskyella sp. 3972H.M.0a.05]|uniref:hypothetical protein n=1 Tax=Winogradskyella sp. 3972H.M.0a.05 TaxID=2950277 RepID=UPI003393F9E9